MTTVVVTIPQENPLWKVVGISDWVHDLPSFVSSTLPIHDGHQPVRQQTCLPHSVNQNTKSEKTLVTPNHITHICLLNEPIQCITGPLQVL